MNDIDFNIIMELDLEKYLNNGPLQIKAIREAKKRVLNDRMKFQQKTIANYRSVIARFNSPDCAFKFPIDQNKDNFPVWRNTVFQNLQNVFAIQKKTSIHSLENLKQVELKNIILALNLSPTDQAYAYVLENQPINNYVALASLCGLIDHAKAVYKEDKKNNFQLVKGESETNLKNDTIEQTFEDYLTLDGKKLLPHLIKEFYNSDISRHYSKTIARLVISLNKAELLVEGYRSNITKLHQGLNKTFGHIGSRQAITKQLSTWDDLDLESIGIQKRLQFLLANIK